MGIQNLIYTKMEFVNKYSCGELVDPEPKDSMQCNAAPSSFQLVERVPFDIPSNSARRMLYGSPVGNEEFKAVNEEFKANVQWLNAKEKGKDAANKIQKMHEERSNAYRDIIKMSPVDTRLQIKYKKHLKAEAKILEQINNLFGGKIFSLEEAWGKHSEQLKENPILGPKLEKLMQDWKKIMDDVTQFGNQRLETYLKLEKIDREQKDILKQLERFR